MKKETFIKKLNKKVDDFNSMLKTAIDTMDGDNSFLYPAGESSVLGETDPISDAKIIGIVDKVDDDGDEFTEISIKLDEGDFICRWYDYDTDTYEFDDYLSYLKRRIKRTMRLWEMDAEQVDREIENDIESDDDDE